MKDAKETTEYRDGKKQGEIDRIENELSCQFILWGKDLVNIASSARQIYMQFLDVERLREWEHGGCDRYLLGYLVGYNRQL